MVAEAVWVESTFRQRQVIAGVLQVVEQTKTESKRRQGLDDVVFDGPTTVVDEEGTLIRRSNGDREFGTVSIGDGTMRGNGCSSASSIAVG